MGATSLLVIRHGHAVAASGRDRDRPLSDLGRAAVADVARLLAAHGLLPAQLHVSPYLRARETAEILARAAAPEARVRLVTQLEPEGDPDAVLDELALSGGGPWLCVSHMPMVGRLVSSLVPGADDPTFAPAGAALVRLPSGLEPRRGSLAWLAAPHEIAGRLGTRG